MSPWWFVILLAIFLIGLTKSGFGAGVGLMIVPMTVAAYAHLPQGSEAALPLLLPLLIAGDLIAVYQWRAAHDWKIIGRLLPGSIVGIILGSLVLYLFASKGGKLAEALINLEIGLESIFLVSLNWYREWRLKHNPPVYQPTVLKSTAVGVFAGVSSTLAHAAGPIIALHLLPQRLPRATFVGTCAFYFFIVNTAKLPGYYAAGLFGQVQPLFAMQFIPLVIVGALAGLWLNRRINDVLFSRIVYAITFILGWYVLARGIYGLTHA